MAESKIVNQGKTLVLFDGTLPAGTTEIPFTLDADSLLVSVFVRSISGTVDISVDTRTYPNEDLNVITFTTISGPSSDLVFQTAAKTLANHVVKVVNSGTVNVQIVAKGLTTLQTITSGGGSGSNADILLGTGVTSRPTITLANTEESISLPTGTKAFMLKNVGSVEVRYSYAVGGTSSAYVTISPNAYKWITNLDATARTIYVRSSKASHQLELERWS
jgi:hypothetical protein